MDGTYGFVFSGAYGIGIGVFTIKNGRFNGADSGGCEYKGTIADNPNDRTLLVKVDQFAPNQGRIAQGISTQPLIRGRTPLEFSLGPNFADGSPFMLDVPPDRVTVMIRRIPIKYRRYAKGLKIVPNG